MRQHISFLTLSTAVLLTACSVAHNCTDGTCTTCTSCPKSRQDSAPTGYFAFDSSVLTSADKEALDTVVSRLNANPREKVKVCGFTDSTGPTSYNQELSVKRATAAADYLESRGISKNRIKITGYGATRFADDNTTAAGRAKNRRVEVRFYQ